MGTGKERGTRAPFSDCVRDMRAGGNVRGHDGRRAVCGVSEGGRIGFAGWAIRGAGGGTGGISVGVRRDVPFVVADRQGERAFAEALRLWEWRQWHGPGISFWSHSI
jgi:hypothetical protein